MVFLFPGLLLWGCARNLAEARPAAQKQTRSGGGAIKRTGFSVKGRIARTRMSGAESALKRRNCPFASGNGHRIYLDHEGRWNASAFSHAPALDNMSQRSNFP